MALDQLKINSHSKAYILCRIIFARERAEIHVARYQTKVNSGFCEHLYLLSHLNSN